MNNNYIETYETLNSKLELYFLLNKGQTAVKDGGKRPFADVIKDIRMELIDEQSC